MKPKWAWTQYKLFIFSQQTLYNNARKKNCGSSFSYSPRNEKLNLLVRIYFYIVLNKNWKIYWSEQSFTGLGLKDCSYQQKSLTQSNRHTKVHLEVKRLHQVVSDGSRISYQQKSLTEWNRHTKVHLEIKRLHQVVSDSSRISYQQKSDRMKRTLVKKSKGYIKLIQMLIKLSVMNLVLGCLMPL